MAERIVPRGNAKTPPATIAETLVALARVIARIEDEAAGRRAKMRPLPGGKREAA